MHRSYWVPSIVASSVYPALRCAGTDRAYPRGPHDPGSQAHCDASSSKLLIKEDFLQPHTTFIVPGGRDVEDRCVGVHSHQCSVMSQVHSLGWREGTNFQGQVWIRSEDCVVASSHRVPAPTTKSIDYRKAYAGTTCLKRGTCMTPLDTYRTHVHKNGRFLAWTWHKRDANQRRNKRCRRHTRRQKREDREDNWYMAS